VLLPGETARAGRESHWGRIRGRRRPRLGVAFQADACPLARRATSYGRRFTAGLRSPAASTYCRSVPPAQYLKRRSAIGDKPGDESAWPWRCPGQGLAGAATSPRPVRAINSRLLTTYPKRAEAGFGLQEWGNRAASPPMSRPARRSSPAATASSRLRPTAPRSPWPDLPCLAGSAFRLEIRHHRGRLACAGWRRANSHWPAV